MPHWANMIAGRLVQIALVAWALVTMCLSSCTLCLGTQLCELPKQEVGLNS